jgi:hypothetical protein
MKLTALLVGLALGAASLGLVACGGSSSSQAATRPTGPGAGARRGFFASNPKVRACLQKHGMTLPNFGNRGRFRRNFNGTVPRRPSNGQRPNFRNNPQFQKLRAALSACGVTPPGQGAPGAAAGNGGSAPAPAATTPSTTQ